MKYIYFFLLLNFISSSILLCQDLALENAEFYSSVRNYESAITEYLRFIFFNPDDEKVSDTYYKIGLAQRNQKNFDRAIDAFKKSISLTNNDSLRDERRIILSTTFIANKEYSIAEFELLKISLFSKYMKIKQKAEFFLGICYVYTHKWEKARISFGNYFSNRNLQFSLKLDSLVAKGEKINYRSLKYAKWLSTFLPGSGQIYSGKIWNGINALILNGLTTFLLVDSIIEKRYKDALISNITIFERYYRGNRHNAEKTAAEYNERKNKEQSKIILEYLSNHKENICEN